MGVFRRAALVPRTRRRRPAVAAARRMAWIGGATPTFIQWATTTSKTARIVQAAVRVQVRLQGLHLEDGQQAVLAEERVQRSEVGQPLGERYLLRSGPRGDVTRGWRQQPTLWWSNC